MGMLDNVRFHPSGNKTTPSGLPKDDFVSAKVLKRKKEDNRECDSFLL